MKTALAIAGLFLLYSLHKARHAKPGEDQLGNCFLAVGKWMDGGHLIVGHSESYYWIPHMCWTDKLPETRAISLSPVDRKYGTAAKFDSPLFYGRWMEEHIGG